MPKEYIEREALINQFDCCGGYTVYGESTVKAIISRIKSQPTADVVEVVRCKDCKHCDPDNRHCDHYMGTVFPVSRKDNDFCSYGERKDGE